MISRSSRQIRSYQHKSSQNQYSRTPTLLVLKWYHTKHWRTIIRIEIILFLYFLQQNGIRSKPEWNPKPLTMGLRQVNPLLPNMLQNLSKLGGGMGWN